MLWNKDEKYTELPYAKETELENAVNDVKQALFGSNRIYLDDKKKIGKKGNTKNIPDGYLIDLTDKQEPKISKDLFCAVGCILFLHGCSCCSFCQSGI